MVSTPDPVPKAEMIDWPAAWLAALALKEVEAGAVVVDDVDDVLGVVVVDDVDDVLGVLGVLELTAVVDMVFTF